MNILYLHGFASAFDAFNEKVKLLESFGKVFGIDLDYTKDFNIIEKNIIDYVLENKIDLVVGTSLGAYYSNIIANKIQIPFIAFNPVTNPKEILRKFIGDFVDFSGNKKHLSADAIESYSSNFLSSGTGLILLDIGDELLDSLKTQKEYSESFKVVAFEGGTHRFKHIDESKEIIEIYINDLIFDGISN